MVKRNIRGDGRPVEIQSKQGSAPPFASCFADAGDLDGMSVKVADEVFILPLNAVMESLQPREEDLHPLAGGERVLSAGNICRWWNCEESVRSGRQTRGHVQGIVVILQCGPSPYAAG